MTFFLIYIVIYLLNLKNCEFSHHVKLEVKSVILMKGSVYLFSFPFLFFPKEIHLSPSLTLNR